MGRAPCKFHFIRHLYSDSQQSIKNCMPPTDPNVEAHFLLDLKQKAFELFT